MNKFILLMLLTSAMSAHATSESNQQENEGQGNKGAHSTIEQQRQARVHRMREREVGKKRELTDPNAVSVENTSIFSSNSWDPSGDWGHSLSDDYVSWGWLDDVKNNEGFGNYYRNHPWGEIGEGRTRLYDFLPVWEDVKESVTGAWNALPSVKDSVKWVKENTWEKLPPMDPIKKQAGSALNTLTSGAGSAWSYLFGKNNAHIDEVSDETDDENEQSHSYSSEYDDNVFASNSFDKCDPWSKAKNCAKGIKINTWDKLPPMDPVKEHAESALNTLTSGVGSAWGYLFGKNNAHVDNAHVEVPHDTMRLSDEDKAFLAEKVLKMRDQRAGRMSTVEKKDLVNRVKEIANRLGVHPHNINEKTKIGALRNFVKNHLDR